MTAQGRHSGEGNHSATESSRSRATKAKVPATKKTTQSARFTDEQMAVINRACHLKGWSIAQLMERAMIEKAAAVCNLEEIDPSGFRAVAKDLLEVWLHGGRLRTFVDGREEDPLRVDTKWEEWEVPATGERGWSCDIQGEEIEATMQEDQRQICIGHRAIEGWQPGDPPHNLCDVRIEVDRPDRVAVQEMFKRLQAAGQEIWPLLLQMLDAMFTAPKDEQLINPSCLFDSTGRQPSNGSPTDDSEVPGQEDEE